MRDITPTEEAVLQSRASGSFLRVEIQNAAAAWIDYSDFLNCDWQDTAEVTQSAEQRIAEATLEIAREVEGVGSLSPLMNADIKVGRGMRISGARVAPGTTPVGGDWKLLFLGVVDTWDAAHDPMQLGGRDLSGLLFDRWIEEPVSDYAEEAGTPVQDVMQAILDDWADGMAVVVPAGSSILTTPFLIRPYLQEPMRVIDALTALNTIGYALEYRWSDSATAFVLTFYEPDREATVPAWEFGPDDYYDVSQLRADRRMIRNAIAAVFTDRSDPDAPVRATYSVEDAASIAAYGRFWMELEFSDTDPIDSAAEAERVVDPALLDLATPYADHEIDPDFFWPVQLGDLYRHSANAVHYAVDQDFAVVAFTHRFEKGEAKTRIQTRGKPIGTVTGWLQREVRRRPPAETGDPQITASIIVRQDDGSAELYGWVSRNTGSVSYAYNVGDDPAQPDVGNAEDQGTGATGGGSTDAIAADGQFHVSLGAATVGFGQLIKGLAIAYAEPGGVGEDATATDHGPPAPFEGYRVKLVSGAQITNGIISAAALVAAAQHYGSDIVFSAPDYDTVEWTAGNVWTQAGVQYTPSSGSTGNLGSDAPRYIYLDTASPGALAVTTNIADAVGVGRIFLCFAKRAPNSLQRALYVPGVGVLGLNQDAIGVNSIVANHINANILTVAMLNALDFQAESATVFDMLVTGTLNADVIVASTSFTATVAQFTGSVGIDDELDVTGSVVISGGAATTVLEFVAQSNRGAILFKSTTGDREFTARNTVSGLELLDAGDQVALFDFASGPTFSMFNGVLQITGTDDTGATEQSAILVDLPLHGGAGYLRVYATP